jgi:hypothetical protein
MVNISQIVLSRAAGPSQATIVLSAILFFAILFLVVMLPVAFFRVKVQDAREQAQFRKVWALLAARARLHRCVSAAPCLFRCVGGKQRCDNLGVAKRNVGDPTTRATWRGWTGGHA